MKQMDLARQAYANGKFKEAFDIWLPIAERGETEAQAWIGSLYANGEGVDVDDQAALTWYQRAAEQGHAMAQANVGAIYFMGRGTDKDVAKAIEWLSAAAEHGDLNGLFNLAVLYSKGEGVEEDHKRAAELYAKAAACGHYPSQSRLGYMYAHGQGVEKDRVQAYLWLSLAAQHGIGTALNALESVVNNMSVEEKAQGVQLFEQWRSTAGTKSDQVALYPMPS